MVMHGGDIEPPPTLVKHKPRHTAGWWVKHKVVNPVLHVLDIRRRRAAVAALLFYIPVCLLFVSGFELHSIWNQLKSVRAEVAQTAQEVRHRHAVSRTLQVAYSMSEVSADFYAWAFAQLSKVYGVPWTALAATTFIESTFNPQAKSPAGACGLMQLMEPTAAVYCKKLGIPYTKDRTVWNPMLNLTLGTAYFADCYYKNRELSPEGKLNEAFKRYLGGAGYRKTLAPSVSDGYKSNVLQEYQKLEYIYKGVITSIK